MNAERLLLLVDLTATVFLGVEGALAGIAGKLDVFGVMVLSFITALGGGIVRDLLIGAVPPNSVRDPKYPIAALAGGAIAIGLLESVKQLPEGFSVTLDAVGLALFCVAGAAKALDHGINPFVAALLGTVTGVGGGTIRDVLLAKVPGVLHTDVYATAALLGAAVLVACVRMGAPRGVAMFAGATACFVLRMAAYSQGWNLPGFGQR